MDGLVQLVAVVAAIESKLLKQVSVQAEDTHGEANVCK